MALDPIVSKLDPIVSKLLCEADWKDITPRLLLYAALKIRMMVWLGQPGGKPPSGVEADDLVQRAIYKVLTGERSWPHEKVTLLRFLMSVIRSDVNNLSKLKENTVTYRIKHLVNQGKHESNIFDNKIDVSNKKDEREVNNPENNIIEKQNLKEIKYILSKLKSDPPAYRFAELVINKEIYKPRDIAKEMGINVREVYNIKKRLRKKLPDIFKCKNCYTRRG